MSARIAFVAAALLIVSAAAHSQPQPKPAPQPPSSGGLIPPPGAPSTPPAAYAVPLGPTAVPPPPEKSVEDLLNELERVQAEKAALEKREQDLKAALRKKLEAQVERLRKLGVAPSERDKVGRALIEGDAPAGDRVIAKPDRVGRIIIEGNTKTADQTVLVLVDFQAGQILHYPALETAKTKLQKAGFTDVTVEVVPNNLDSGFKDVRVKLTEPNPPPVVPLNRS